MPRTRKPETLTSPTSPRPPAAGPRSQASRAGAAPNGAAHASAASAASAPPSSPAEVSGWTEQLRLPLSWSLQTLMLMLHAGEEWQRAQLDSWHLALRHHEQAHQRLLQSQDAAEMASLHADLLRFDTANFTQLAQRCMDTGVHLNTNVARLVAQSLDGSRSHLMRSAFESLQTGLHTGIRPLDQLFNAPLLRELSLRGPFGPGFKAES